MRLGFVYDCAYPYSKGGVEKRIFEFAHRLADRHEVHLFCMKYWQGTSIRREDGIVYHGVCPALPVYTPSGKRRISQALAFSVSLLPALLRTQLDLLECQNIPYFPCFTSFLYSRLRKTPLLLVWYEVWGDYWYDYLGWKGIFGKLLERLATRLTPHNLAASPRTQREFLKLCAAKIPVIPPVGMDLKEMHESPSSPERFDVLTVGRLIPDKNVALLLESLALLDIPRLCCGIIGDGPERGNLERLAKRLNLNGKVQFLGFVEEVYPYMKAAKLFVLPSQREGFGIVVLEANACGLPVLVLEHPNSAATELILENNGFLFKDAADPAAKLTLLLSDEKLLKAMSASALVRGLAPETLPVETSPVADHLREDTPFQRTAQWV